MLKSKTTSKVWSTIWNNLFVTAERNFQTNNLSHYPSQCPKIHLSEARVTRISTSSANGSHEYWEDFSSQLGQTLDLYFMIIMRYNNLADISNYIACLKPKDIVKMFGARTNIDNNTTSHFELLAITSRWYLSTFANDISSTEILFLRFEIIIPTKNKYCAYVYKAMPSIWSDWNKKKAELQDQSIKKTLFEICYTSLPWTVEWERSNHLWKIVKVFECY